MTTYTILSPTGKKHNVQAETKYIAIQRVVEEDGYIYSNSQYKAVKRALSNSRYKALNPEKTFQKLSHPIVNNLVRKV